MTNTSTPERPEFEFATSLGIARAVINDNNHMAVFITDMLVRGIFHKGVIRLNRNPVTGNIWIGDSEAEENNKYKFYTNVYLNRSDDNETSSYAAKDKIAGVVIDALTNYLKTRPEVIDAAYISARNDEIRREMKKADEAREVMEGHQIKAYNLMAALKPSVQVQLDRPMFERVNVFHSLIACRDIAKQINIEFGDFGHRS